MPDENVDPTFKQSIQLHIWLAVLILYLFKPGPVGGLQPIVLDQAGALSLLLSAGVMASTLLQPDNVDVSDLTGTEFFNYIATQDASNAMTTRDNTFGRANAGAQGDSFRPESENIRVDTVSGDTIIRSQVFDVVGIGQEDSKNRAAIDAAAVFADINIAANQIVSVTVIEEGLQI